MASKRVLSIQSHVIHGYVGNKCATFPLQVLGFDVDPINSVQLSNHTGYKHIKGQRMNDSELKDVFDGIVLNDLHGKYSHLLTGYIGTPEFLKKIADVVKTLKKANPKLVFFCDPVMGDNDKFYVPESFVEIYRDDLIPLADIVSPNQFEAELLSGQKIQTEDDAWKVLDWFHSRGVQTAVISSTTIGAPDNLKAFLSELPEGSAKPKRSSLLMPKIGKVNFTGTGDLFAALFLAHTTSSKAASEALEKTVASLQAVIRNTAQHLPSVSNPETQIASVDRELRIVQSKRDIEEPKFIIRAIVHS
ncbi:pyridoxal kinase [Phlebotomus papatasi]|uniref:Pyridoxal kinase n=1 Tax=Phlebotomus papatasi TaxID=29031 RepID=A0A1B0DAQ1_PHLPP|nr:pyridoxal kinase [Phlebotomus papatasi]XP_055702973.1 pyridoxal kinase [Phlebotomus papatasi]